MCSITPYVQAIAKKQYFEINYSCDEKLMFIGNNIPEQLWTDFHNFHTVYSDYPVPVEVNDIFMQNKILFRTNIGVLNAVPFVNIIMWLVLFNNIMKDKKLIYFNTEYGLHIIEINQRGINYTFIQQRFLSSK